MDCIAPEEIREGDLLAYVEGRVDQRVRDHVAHCPFCATEVAALEKVDHVLSATLYRASCPATEVLVQYQEKLLPAREQRTVNRHVQGCALCTGELRRLSALDAPQYSLWEEMRRAARTVIEAVRVRPPAHLALAVRGGRFKQRLYRAGELDIVLGSEAPQPPHDLWRVRGRVTRGGLAMTELTDHTVQLVQENSIVDSQALDDMGYFSFEHLSIGTYDVWLAGLETDIVVRQVVVGAMATDADKKDTST